MTAWTFLLTRESFDQLPASTFNCFDPLTVKEIYVKWNAMNERTTNNIVRLAKQRCY
jgi:hypothetical protein